MKKEITFIVIIFLVTLFAVGQKTELIKNELFGKSKTEAQLKGLKHDDIKVRQNHLFQKSRIYPQNSNLKSAQANKQKLDSIVTHDWEEAASQWIAYEKSEFIYDSNPNNAQSIYYYKDGTINQWVTENKEEYAYDVHGNMTQFLSYFWVETTNEWSAYEKSEYTYNANGNMTQSIFYGWDGYASQWIPYSKNEYTYNTNGDMTQILEYFWEETISQLVAGSKLEYTYNANGNMALELIYIWDETTSQWVTCYKNEYTYDTIGNMTQELGYYWDENASLWYVQSKEEYIYDTFGNMVQFLYYHCYETPNQWVAFLKNESTYDNSYSFSDLIIPYSFGDEAISMHSNHMLTGSEFYMWDTPSNDWKPYMELSFYYSELNSNSISEISRVGLNVYPNPFSTSVYFDISGDYNNITLVLFDIQGRKVISKEIRNNEKVSMDGLNKGMYFYNLTINGKKLNGKLIKE